jgi:hypothetical protein
MQNLHVAAIKQQHVGTSTEFEVLPACLLRILTNLTNTFEGLLRVNNGLSARPREGRLAAALPTFRCSAQSD